MGLKKDGLNILARILGADYNGPKTVNNTQNNMLIGKKEKEALRAALAADDTSDEGEG